MERKIGEIFEYNGEWYQCVEDTEYSRCINCCFYNGGHKLCTDKDMGNCAGEYRSDAKYICFKKLEKVGEPYGKRVSDGTFSTFQRYKLYNYVILPKKPYIYCNFIDGTIEIEIKQNKEDMEEKKVRLKKEDIDFLYNKFIEITEDCVVKGYDIDNVQHEFGKLFLIKDSDTKLNLKPFDLEAAKAGKPVCTRDGRKARIICFDAKRKNKKSIIALVPSKDYPGFEDLIAYPNNGNYYGGHENDGDLMMLPEKKEGWAVIRRCDIYETEEQAKEVLLNSRVGVMIRKIEWEE